MSSQHLWNLLQGRVVLAADDVVLAELRENVGRISCGLTYYKAYQPSGNDGKEKEEKLEFPTLPKFIREEETGEDEGKVSTSDAKKEVSFDQLRKAIAQNLNLEEGVAEELLENYMMFEYKGSSTSYDTIIDTHRSFLKFLAELSEFYMRERTCLLLCTQAILARQGDEEDNFYNIIETFLSLISAKDWCQSLLSSIPLAKDDSELIEILHCLLLLSYKLPEASIPQLLTYFSNPPSFSQLRKSESMKIAEGALLSSTLLVAGLTDCCSGVVPTSAFGPMLKDFLLKNFDSLLLNPFNIAPVFASFTLFCQDDPELTLKMTSISSRIPITLFDSLVTLTSAYGKGSVSDRHSISLIVSSSVFETFEALLANFDGSHFGTKSQAFKILAKILQHSSVAENFLCGHPPALTELYTEATSLFPLDVASTLMIWRSLCLSVKNREDCNILMTGLAGLNCVAEFLDDEAVELFTKRRGASEFLNCKNRKIFGTEVEKGARGTLSKIEEDLPYISWELLQNSSNSNAFSAIRQIIEPVAEYLGEFAVGKELEPGNVDYLPKVVFSVAEFVISFMRKADKAVDEVNYLVHPTCIILGRMISISRDPEEKEKLVKYLLGIVGAVNEFLGEEILLFNYIYEGLPGGGAETVMNQIENIILREESVKMTKGQVTLAVLDLLASFAENEKAWNQNQTRGFSSKFLESIAFISQSILGTLPSWRIIDDGTRLQIYFKCLSLFSTIFSLDSSWSSLKKNCLKHLITPNSCLLALLGTSESVLLSSIITPTPSTFLILDVVCLALKLLHKIILFDKRVLVHVDNLLENGLVPILSAHLRHRLNPTLPTLSVMILKQIAEHSNISLVGNNPTSFRDVLTQRLELIAEDINLKIVVLDFLTISFQTQQNIMGGFFSKDSTLEKNVLELISYQNPDLSSAALNFFVGLFRQNLQLASKTTENFWEKILNPINNLEEAGVSKVGADIVAATLHILIFELYKNNLSEDSQLSSVLEQFLKNGQVQLIVKAMLEEKKGEQATKSLTALKHFFLLILGRPQLASKLITGEVLISLQNLILESFWKDSEENERRSKTLVELVTILTTGESCSASFLGEILLKLMETFKFLPFSVKLSMLCLLNKCFSHWKPPKPQAGVETNGIIENTLRIIKTISKNSSINLEELMGNPETSEILGMSSTLLKTIVENTPFSFWGQVFQQELVVLGLLSIACVGIKTEKALPVVSSALAALIAISEDPEGFKLLPARGMSSLWLHLHKFTDGKAEWDGIFMLCLNLNSKLLQSLKRDYLDEALGFWGLFGGFLILKLGEMLNLTEICLRGIGDGKSKGFEDLQRVISTNIFVLNGILSLMPYLEDWQKSQRVEVFKGIRAVFQALQEALGLLRQPLLLKSSFSLGKSGEEEDPKLGELQGGLWTLSDLATNILLKLKGKEEEFIEKGALIPVMFQVGQLCIKVLSSKTDCGRISSVLEKVMLVVHNFTVPVLEDPTRDIKFQIGFRREYSTEVVSLIDGIRRLNIPKNDFLINICTRMETKFK